MMSPQTEERIRGEANRLNTSDDLSIWAYGMESQNALNDFSKEMAGAVSVSSSDQSGEILREILSEIDEAERQNSSFKARFSSDDVKRREYRALLRNINQAVLQLQLSQAALIKDVSWLQKMQEHIQDCMEELQFYIDTGQKRLQVIKDALSSEGQDANRPDAEEWCVRLEKKIQNLEMSKTVALQNSAEIMLLIKNDRQLIDQLGDCVTITIPLWRNQISIAMGLEHMTESLKMEKQLAGTIRKSVRGRSRRATGAIDEKKARESNEELKKAVEALIQMTENGQDIAEKERGLLKKLRKEKRYE